MIEDPEDDIIVWNSSENGSDKIEETIEIQAKEEVEIEWRSDSLSDKTDSDEDLDADDSDSSVYEKKYYKISEVESIIGENQSTIRYWEESFAELGKNFCSLRSRGGTRRYTKENIENLKLLKLLLRERRLTIEGAISLVRNERKRNVKEKALILLQETRDELNNLIDAYNCILHQNSELE